MSEIESFRDAQLIQAMHKAGVEVRDFARALATLGGPSCLSDFDVGLTGAWFAKTEAMIISAIEYANQRRRREKTGRRIGEMG
jgi:hypothetical protein